MRPKRVLGGDVGALVFVLDGCEGRGEFGTFGRGLGLGGFGGVEFLLGRHGRFLFLSPFR